MLRQVTPDADQMSLAQERVLIENAVNPINSLAIVRTQAKTLHAALGTTIDIAGYIQLLLSRRKALLDKAGAEDFLIVEDDYEFEMAFLKSPSPALKSLDRDGRVIYVGSFSKSLFPGLRLGYLVGPAPFIREARALRASVLRHAPGHIQRTTAHYLSLGHYDALVKRTGRAFHERRRTLDEALNAHGMTVAGAGAYGGSSVWIALPPGTKARDLAQDLQEDGVLIEPGDRFFAGDDVPQHFARLAYSSIPASRIAQGVARIAARIGKG